MVQGLEVDQARNGWKTLGIDVWHAECVCTGQNWVTCVIVIVSFLQFNVLLHWICLYPLVEQNTVQYNSIWCCLPSNSLEVHVPQHDRTLMALRSRLWRICMRYWHNDRLNGGSNTYSPYHLLHAERVCIDSATMPRNLKTQTCVKLERDVILDLISVVILFLFLDHSCWKVGQRPVPG